jgi:exopolyphosphatase
MTSGCSYQIFFSTMTLLQFLRQARQLHRQFLSGALSESPIYVIGNPSADLDSIVSAIIYSFCANNRLPLKAPRPHIPLLNLPNVLAGPELYRLRPEFATALWLSTNFPALRAEEQFENAQDSAGNLLGSHLVTVADFAQNLKEQNIFKQLLAEATLVDWNSLPIPSDKDKGSGSLPGLPGVTFRAVGCIDHHVDEKFMSSTESLPENQPLIIQPGPGSCASLVTRDLQNRTLMGDGQAISAEMVQVAKLALSAVLIDTSNLTAEGKVTDVDREAVKTLQSQIAGQLEAAKVPQDKWNLQAFYEGVLNAKQNSLDLLNLDEVLDRDYKDWTETAQSSGKTVKMGFCSSVKPIRWVVQKAGTPEKFLDAVRSFAATAEKELDVVVVMTAFTAADGSFCRELFVCVVRENESALEGVKAFVEQTTSRLRLEEWSPLDGENISELGDVCSALNWSDTPFWRRLWIQKNAAGSRKQVAPLLRTAVSKL